MWSSAALEVQNDPIVFARTLANQCVFENLRRLTTSTVELASFCTTMIQMVAVPSCSRSPHLEDHKIMGYSEYMCAKRQNIE